MFIAKKSLPRRTFLRGMGTALALPLLDAMVPALSAMAATPAAGVRRMGFIYMPNGVAMNFKGVNYWRPKGEGADFEFSQILKPLEGFRDRMTVFSGLTQHQADVLDDGANGDHTRGTSSWLTGVHPRAHRRRRYSQRDFGRSNRRATSWARTRRCPRSSSRSI